MHWYCYLLEFLGGAFLANGVPHFVQGTSGNPFPSPFSKPPGRGDSSPLTNALWGFANLLAGALLLHFFWPVGCAAWAGRGAVGLGVLLMAVQSSVHFGKVRSGKLR
jgi:hypothetical protein